MIIRLFFIMGIVMLLINSAGAEDESCAMSLYGCPEAEAIKRQTEALEALTNQLTAQERRYQLHRTVNDPLGRSLIGSPIIIHRHNGPDIHCDDVLGEPYCD